MAVSQGNFSSGPVGLTLKAWGMINGTTGAIVSQSGFATFTRSAAGSYPFTFSAAAANTNFLVVATAEQSSGLAGVYMNTVSVKTTAGATVNNYRSDTVTTQDCAMLHIEVYT